METNSTNQNNVGSDPRPAEETKTPFTVPDSLLEAALDETLTRQLAQRRIDEDQFIFDQHLAQVFTASGAFADCVKGEGNRLLSNAEAVARAMVKIALGRSMKFSPAESMLNVDIIKGRPSIAAQAQATRMKQHGYDWVIAQHNDKGCVILPKKNGQYIMEAFTDETGDVVMEADGLTPKLRPAKVSFTEDDARRAKLIKTDGGYETYPKNMYWTRAISNMRRWHASETLFGMDIATTEETKEAAAMEAEARRRMPDTDFAGDTARDEERKSAAA